MPHSLLPSLHMFSLIISLACLASCGGDNGAPVGAAQPSLPAAHPVRLPSPNLSGLPAASPVVIPAGAATVLSKSERGVRRELPGAGALTNIVLENTGTADQAGAPVTFGHIFADGDFNPGDIVWVRESDGNMTMPQVDVKARHPSGAVRHAVLTMLAPALAPGQRRSVDLVRVTELEANSPPPPPTAPQSPSALLARGFSARIGATMAGVTYSASADALLRSGKYSTWLSGPLVNEWLVSAPLTDANGVAHPHLSARFAIRAVSGSNRARVDVTIENAWAYEPAPQNFTYDAEVAVGGAVVYAKPALTHFHHARWRRVFWWGAAPQIHVRHNTGYLIASKAVPNYDQSVAISEASLSGLTSAWTGARTEPMGSGMAVPYMPGTGGRSDIGILPGWAATYLISMDKRAKEVTLGTADQAGSWPVHYRNKTTGRPVTLQDYPYMTILGHLGDTLNPATRKHEAFPPCGTGGCSTPYLADASHQPGFSYLPYLVSGDHYYLEEMQFWAMWNSFFSNPEYRHNIKGLLAPDQVRGQGWSLRTLAQAAYITPDSDPLKPQLLTLLDHNLNWYNANYSNNPTANALGILVNGAALAYSNGTGVAPWQDDFFTAAVGVATELGYQKAKPLLAYKARFPISRMTGAGSCWITGASYSLVVRDSSAAPFYTGIGKAMLATQGSALSALPCASAEMAAYLQLQKGEMTGHSSTILGYPSNMQPALAFAADAGGAAGRQAWKTFSERSVKPDYGLGPQFAIVPRVPTP